MVAHADVKDKSTQKAIDQFIARLRRRCVDPHNLNLTAGCLTDACFRQVVGSRATALETVILIRQVVASARFSTIEQLVGIIQGVGKRIQAAQPQGANLISNTR